MNRTEKEQIVASLNERFARARFVSLVAFQGLNVAQISSLRHELRNADTEFRVVKNTLARRAIRGTPLETIEEYFTGSTAVALSSQDPAPAAKVLTRFAKENPHLEIKVGLLEGIPIPREKIEDLSKLPPRDVLYSMLLGTLQAPMSGLVNTLAGILRKFLGTLHAIQQEKEKCAAP